MTTKQAKAPPPAAAGSAERLIAPVAAALATAKRVAIVRLGSIGDVVETLPFAFLLRELLPAGARLEWIVHAEAAPLLAAVPALDAVRAIPRARGLGAIGAWRAAVAHGDYDLLFDLHGNVKSGAVALLSHARMRVGFDRKDCRESLNALFMTHALPKFASDNKTRRALELGRWLGGGGGTEFDFEFPDQANGRARRVVAAAAAAAKPVAILQLGRLGDVRSWPTIRYVEVALSLTDQGHHVIVTGGKADAEARDELCRLLVGERPAALQFEVGTLDLLELGATFQQLARDTARRHVFVGPDGGCLHLAAACGMRVVGLFGPQDPLRVAPIGARVTLLHHREAAPCVPCARRECSYAVPNACMASISAADVAASVAGRVASAPAATPQLLPVEATAPSRASGGRVATAVGIVAASLAPLLFAALRERPWSPLWSRATATSVLTLVAVWFAARLGGRRCALLAGLFLLGMSRVAWSDAGNPLDLFAAASVIAALALYAEARVPSSRLGPFGVPLAAAAIAGSVLVAGSDGLLLSLTSLALFELGERTPRRLLEPGFVIPCLLLAPLAIVVRPAWMPEALLHEHVVSWGECGRFVLIGLLPASLAAPFALFQHLKSRRFREDLGIADRAWRFPKAALLAAAIGLLLTVCRGTAMVLFAPLLALLLAAWCERLWLSIARSRMHVAR